jgi:hypothetical protein
LEHKGDLDVRNWAIYWTILALFTCVHSLMDCTLCWLPGYYFLKLGFVAALWHPNMQLAVWLYERSVGPLLGSYEVREVRDSFVAAAANYFSACAFPCCCVHQTIGEVSLMLMGNWLAPSTTVVRFEVRLHGCAVATCSWLCGCMRGAWVHCSAPMRCEFVAVTQPTLNLAVLVLVWLRVV